MGKKWTTPEQEAWLKDRMPTFIATQKTRTSVSAFYPELHKEWRKNWPDPQPTEKEIQDADGNLERAMKMKQTHMDEVSDPHGCLTNASRIPYYLNIASCRMVS